MPLLVAVLVGVLIAAVGIGGVGYYLARSGRFAQQGYSTAKEEPPPIQTHVMVLDSLLVNLADAGGNAYLRVSMVLRVATEPGKKPAQSGEKTADDEVGSRSAIAVRDTALTVLGNQTSDSLLAINGKERLKAELKTAFAKRNPDLKVVSIFFTDFLVQR